MKLPPKSLALPIRLWRRLPSGLLAAGAAVALNLVAYARLQNAAPREPRAASAQGLPVAASAAPVAGDPDLGEGFTWDWPDIMAAAAMYHCRPTGEGAPNTSVVVWTDQLSRVVAFGSSREGEPMPPYARALAEAGVAERGQAIHAASEGHVVHTSGEAHALQLGGTALACVPTWDD